MDNWLAIASIDVLIVVIPSSLVAYGPYLVFLSWYLCRIAPHQTPRTVRVVTYLLGPAVATAIMWGFVLLGFWIVRELGWLVGPGHQWQLPLPVWVFAVVDVVLFIPYFALLSWARVYFSRHRSD